jgi:hypothetical protein
MRHRLVILVATGLLLAVSIGSSGCAGRVDRQMGSWVGHHQSELIRAWGPPNQTASDGDGGTILIYGSYVNLGQTPGTATVSPYGKVRYTAPQQQGYSRTRMFYVDRSGRIYAYRWKGL